mgnify:CR=1 FL=1
MNGKKVLELFVLYKKARSGKEHAINRRVNSRGIAVDEDPLALDYQAADCLERRVEIDIYKECGQALKEERCRFCGSYVESCWCETLAKRGIDTKTIRVEEGCVVYDPPKED